MSEKTSDFNVKFVIESLKAWNQGAASEVVEELHARAESAEAKRAAAEKTAIYWREIATQSSGEACTEQVRRMESEAKYAALVERLRALIDEPLKIIRISDLKAAINESEAVK